MKFQFVCLQLVMIQRDFILPLELVNLAQKNVRHVMTHQAVNLANLPIIFLMELVSNVQCIVLHVQTLKLVKPVALDMVFITIFA